jgi:oxygen tolerance protein BatD
MRWIKVIFASLYLLAPVGNAIAQSLDELAYETIEPSRIKLGESATLRVTSFGRIKDVALPTIPGLVFEAIGRSQGFDFVNGSTISATFFLIRVTPQFAGVFSIPGLTPGSRSIGLEVVKGDEPNPYTWRSQQPAPAPMPTASLPKGVQLQAGGAAFVNLAIPARPIYVGESVPVEIEVGLRPGIVTSVNGLPTLKGSDFTFNNLSRQPERREETIEGGAFVLLTWHSALAAVKPGDFALSAEAPLTVKMSTLSAADRAVASRLAFPLLQSMYNGVAPRDMTIESSPSRLKVLPLPTDGQPENFSGAVGDFHVSSDVSPPSVAAGEPLTLRLHISGAGNFDRVDSTMFDHLDHWKTYPAKSSFIPSDAVGNEGEKVFEQPLIAAQPGEQSIPGLDFSYFNPNTRQYERAQTPVIKVTVADSLASSSLSALTGTQKLNGTPTTGASRGLRPDHPPPKSSVSDLRPLYFRVPFLTIPTTLALLLAGSWFAVRPNAARATSRAVKRALAQLGAAARAGDSSSFFEAARKTLLQTFAARWQMPADQITAAELKARLGTTGEDLERLFALADEARYSDNQPGGTDFKRWLSLIRGQLAGERE